MPGRAQREDYEMHITPNTALEDAWRRTFGLPTADPWLLFEQRNAWRDAAIESAREVARLRAELSAVAAARDSAVRMARASNHRYLHSLALHR